MLPRVRDEDCDVFVFHPDGHKLIAALFNAPGITNFVLYHMVLQFSEFSHIFFLRDSNGANIFMDNTRLISGKYTIVTDGTVLSPSSSISLS